MDLALYIACVFGALAVYMMMPRRGFSPVVVGGVLGAATLGGLWLSLGDRLTTALGMGRPVFAYYYVFSAIAIGSAARVVTHRKPVHAALWFVLAILATAGLLLLLGAEFVAFAMIIIYGGAILVTYMFVIMLATQSAADGGELEHDVSPREPLAATTVGFLLLALLLGAMFTGPGLAPNAKAAAPTDAALIQTALTQRRSSMELSAGDQTLLAKAMPIDRLENTERVGVDLFRAHPLGLELAGVVLLVSLIGAVVIARQHVPAGKTT